ncbi:MAG: molybdopterin molybdotransferase MoeA [Candidatus Hecatellaceae archaeon]
MVKALRDVRFKGFHETIPLGEAVEKLVREASVRLLEAEEAPLLEASGRVLAEDVFSPTDVPPFDRAAMDGYAVKAEDTQGASASNPVLLKLSGEAEIGSEYHGFVNRGEAVQVGTGTPIPDGANSVLMFEYSKLLEDGRTLEVYKPLAPGENVAKAGEDVKAGEKVLPEGRVLLPPDIALLAAMGLSRVKVRVKPRVAVLSIGGELVEPEAEVAPGKIHDSNRYFLLSALQRLGCTPLDLGIAPDRAEEIGSRISRVIREAHLYILCGGSSVGGRDVTLDALKGLEGFRLLFHGVSIRPGRPLAAGVLKGKPVIILPGYPAATMLTFHVFARKILGLMLGVKPAEFRVEGRLTRRVASQPGILDLVRVRVRMGEDGVRLIEPLRAAGAGVISSMVKADGLLLVPEPLEGYEQDETVEVELFRLP